MLSFLLYMPVNKNSMETLAICDVYMTHYHSIFILLFQNSNRCRHILSGFLQDYIFAYTGFCFIFLYVNIEKYTYAHIFRKKRFHAFFYLQTCSLVFLYYTDIKKQNVIGLCLPVPEECKAPENRHKTTDQLSYIVIDIVLEKILTN